MRLVLSFVLVWAIAYFKPSAGGLRYPPRETKFAYDFNYFNPQKKIDFIGCGQRPLATGNGALEVEQITSHAQEAIPHSHPSLCSIRQIDVPELHRCSGVLVKNLYGNYYLITSYTCIKALGYLSYKAYCGVYNSIKCEQQVVTVTFRNVFTNYHHAWVPHCDIGILELTSQLPFNLYISAACLPNEDWLEGEIGLYAGWYSKSDRSDFHDNVHQFQTRIRSRNRCQAIYGYHMITVNMLCSSLPRSGFIPCGYDRGAPLFTYRENRWILTGISNWIPNCAQPDRLVTYTDVFAVKEWIDEAINDR